MKTAIIGCGKVADAHAAIISTIPKCTIVAVCDTEPLMAQQMQERYKTHYWFSDIDKLLDKAQPDIVHITTPPQSQYPIVKSCLEAGKHVYVEKPFVLNSDQAEELIKLAIKKNVKLTVGTNFQYSLVALRVREMVKNGFLGNSVVHIESIFGYSLEDGFAKAFLGNKNHWVRKLPGKLLHNIISHGIARIAEFLEGENPQVIAKAFTSEAMLKKGGNDIHDELRTIITDSNGTTAYFTFSSQISPPVHQFRLYGSKNSLLVDDDHQTILKEQSHNYKSYLSYFLPPLLHGKQYASNALYNVRSFAKRTLYMDSGKMALIEALYRSITEDLPPPIPYSEILRTSRIMDSIFKQININ